MNVVGIKFNSAVKIYDFLPGTTKPEINNWVLVDTTQGKEMGRVVYINKEVQDNTEGEFKEIIKIADEKDIDRYNRMIAEGEVHFPRYQECVKEMALDMKPVKTEVSFDGERVVCYFTAENRVDFRELIRELSRDFKKSIIMRQIGPRDEAKLLDGYGICGQRVCCKRFLTKTESITMDMAREQFENNINANKVTGLCGRLMCCLAFEVDPSKTKRK
ncbi:MAG: regulatory iron-sulfur-containing complex subunit RicT [bacterium]